MPKVSIILPVFNNEQTLTRTIDSVLSQSYSDFELLIIDNGSTDNSKNVIINFTNKDSRVKYLYTNIVGRSHARNIGLKNSSGKYVQFIDSDDEISRDKVERSVSFLEQNEDHFGVATSTTYIFDNTKETKQAIIDFESFTELYQGNKFTINSLLFRNSKIIPFNEDLEFLEDWLFWVENLRGKLLKVSPKIFGAIVHVTGTNTSRDFNQMMYMEIFVKALIRQRYGKVKMKNKNLKNFFIGVRYILYRSDKYSIDKYDAVINSVYKKYIKLAYLALKIPLIGQIIRRREAKIKGMSIYTR